MSRIGKQPIVIPAGVTVQLTEGQVTVTGPKGQLHCEVHPDVLLHLQDNQLTVSVKNPEDKTDRSLWGLFRKLIANMVEGVTTGFQKKLEINGVGYRAALQGATLVLNLGYSHPVTFALPEGISAVVEGNTITVSGADRQLVGQVAADIRKQRKPEPYKGKGIKYVDEVIRRKAGKAAKAAA
ncbi:50S ribosomal protein L6 [Candidatus Falkowbacteria bacterium]|nr:50S ribosomal protein L6 [Candidatus Falkowbacteria bacterium]